MGSITGTPKQWWHTITRPATWFRTEPYSEWNESMTETRAEATTREATNQAEAALQVRRDELSAKTAADTAKFNAEEKAASDKRTAEAAAAAKTAADLAARRRGTSPYATSQGGLLGLAPTKLKTLLGQ